VSCWCHQLARIRHSLSCCGVTSQHPSLFEATEKWQTWIGHVIFEIFTAVTVTIVAFWNVTPCSLVQNYQSFWQTYGIVVCPVDGCSRFLRNLYILKLVYIICEKVEADWFCDSAQTSPGCCLLSDRHTVARCWCTCNCTVQVFAA